MGLAGPLISDFPASRTPKFVYKPLSLWFFFGIAAQMTKTMGIQHDHWYIFRPVKLCVRLLLSPQIGIHRKLAGQKNPSTTSSQPHTLI